MITSTMKSFILEDFLDVFRRLSIIAPSSAAGVSSCRSVIVGVHGDKDVVELVHVVVVIVVVVILVFIVVIVV